MLLKGENQKGQIGEARQTTLKTTENEHEPRLW